MTASNISTLTPEIMQELLQEAGYRVESFVDPAGTTQLRSATNGLPFVVRFGNRLAGESAGYSDASFTTVLQVQGALPPTLVNQWNGSKRFGRLYHGENILILEMDFTVMGGVSRDNLKVQINVWDSVVQELIRYLRTMLAPSTEASAANGRAENAPTGSAISGGRQSQSISPVA